MIDWAAIINKVPELAALLLVVWYSLEMNKQNKASSKEIMSAWMVWLTNEGQLNRDFMEKTVEQFKEFVNGLAATQEHSNELTRAAVHANGEKLATLLGIVGKIDDRTRPVKRAPNKE